MWPEWDDIAVPSPSAPVDSEFGIYAGGAPRSIGGGEAIPPGTPYCCLVGGVPLPYVFTGPRV